MRHKLSIEALVKNIKMRLRKKERDLLAITYESSTVWQKERSINVNRECRWFNKWLDQTYRLSSKN